MHSKKLLGFTLAEMLLAMSIVGIIAAITVPTLQTNHQRRAFTVGIEKAYAEFTQVMSIFMVKEFVKDIPHSYLAVSSATPSDAEIENSAGKFLNKYFRVSQDIGTTNTAFASQYSSIEGTYGPFPCKGYSVVTERGSAICMEPAVYNGGNFTNAKVYVDLNGTEEPNIGGRDLFIFEIDKDANVTYKFDPAQKNTYEEACKKSLYGDKCLEAIMSSGWKMEY